MFNNVYVFALDRAAREREPCGKRKKTSKATGMENLLLFMLLLSQTKMAGQKCGGAAVIAGARSMFCIQV